MTTSSVFFSDDSVLFILVLGQLDQKLIMLPLQFLILAITLTPSKQSDYYYMTFSTFPKCESEGAFLNCFDPQTPEGDWVLISPYSITLKSKVKVQ